MKQNKKGQTDSGLLSIFVIIMSSLIFIAMICFLVYDVVSNGYERREIRKDFCRGELVYGSGSISYCDGKPFVCNDDSCFYVSKYEDCSTRYVYKGVSRTECDEVDLE